MDVRDNGAEEGENGQERDGMQECEIWEWVAGEYARLVREEKDEEGEEETYAEGGTPQHCPYRVVVLPPAPGNISGIRKREYIQRSCAPVPR